MNKYFIEEGVFTSRTFFIANCSQEELARFVKKRYKIEMEDLGKDTCGTVLSYYNEDYRYTERVVWVQYFNRNSEEDIAILTHEIVHLVVRICDHKGVPIVAENNGYPGDETAAYLTRFFVREFLTRFSLSEKNKKKKKKKGKK